MLDALQILTTPQMVVDDPKALRDKFAMAALVTLCNSRHEIYGPEHVAKVSYEYADAMMKAREAK